MCWRHLGAQPWPRRRWEDRGGGRDQRAKQTPPPPAPPRRQRITRAGRTRMATRPRPQRKGKDLRHHYKPIHLQPQCHNQPRPRIKLHQRRHRAARGPAAAEGETKLGWAPCPVRSRPTSRHMRGSNCVRAGGNTRMRKARWGRVGGNAATAAPEKPARRKPPGRPQQAQAAVETVSTARRAAMTAAAPTSEVKYPTWPTAPRLRRIEWAAPIRG